MTAFEGVRVLDFAREAPGSLAAMALADFGAEVLKVHAPRADDPADALMWGRNKVLLPAGADLDARVRGADVVIVDDAPRALAASRFNAAACAKLNARLVHAWLPPYGHAGEESELAASHLLLSGMTANSFRQGSYGDCPVCLVAPLLHYGQGVLGAALIAASLIARARDGAGRSVRLSGLDAVSQMNGAARDVGASVTGVARPVGGMANYRLYGCADGKWLFLGSLFEPFVTRAREVLGIGPITGDIMLDEPLYLAALASKPRDEWVRLLREAGVPTAPVGENKDWLESEPVRANKLAVRLTHEALGEVTMPGLYAQLSATPGRIEALLREGDAPDWRANDAGGSAGGPLGPPLAGVKVLDMGVVIAGAAAGAILANFGADVVKVEGAEGDPFRSSGLVSAAFNRGKRALGIDLKSEAGRGAFLRLAEQADVVLDNFRLGVRERLKIDYQSLRAINPRIVSCSLTAYGRVGERAAWPGFDPLLQAESGLAQRQGGRGKEPVYHQMAINDVASAAVCAFSILAALHARLARGEGQEIVTSLTSQSVFYQARAFTTFAGAPEADDGDRDCVGVRALERFYQCGESWLAIDVRTQAAAGALGDVLGVEMPPDALVAARDGALSEKLAAACAEREAGELARALRAAGVPATQARRAEEAWIDPYLAENGYWVRYAHPLFGDVIGVTGYGATNGQAHPFTRPAPLLGQHTRAVLADGGFSEAEIDALYEAGAVFGAPA